MYERVFDDTLHKLFSGPGKSSLAVSQMPRSDWAQNDFQTAPQSFSSLNPFLMWPVDSHHRTPEGVK